MLNVPFYRFSYNADYYCLWYV